MNRVFSGSWRSASEWKYVPIRRLALYIEESLYRETRWVVFESNDNPFGQIRLNVGAFMQTLFRRGAFQGRTLREAYFVKRDKATTTHNDVDRGIVGPQFSVNAKPFRLIRELRARRPEGRRRQRILPLKRRGREWTIGRRTATAPPEDRPSLKLCRL